MTRSRSAKALVTFWGTRGSVPTPGSTTEKYGGNTACVSVEYGGTEIILDAGTGIRALGISIMDRAQQRVQTKKTKKQTLHLLLSHTHWDHIQGLPFFDPAYTEGTKLIIYGSPKKGRFLDSILAGQMDVNYFPVDMNALSADITIKEIASDTVSKIGRVDVSNQEQIRHPGGSLRYRLKCGTKTIVYATDVELNTFMGTNPKTKQNRTLAKQYREFIRDADLLIADGQYTEQEYDKRKGLKWGHTSIPLLIKTAYEEGVKQLAVFHHDPQNSDSVLDSLWARYAPEYNIREPAMNIFWAREGMTLAI
ncbi:MAG: MBL fold metallo-hydrolase [Kiritimatiellae bacterium]|nr:MBL fold metallo-hydrolase [Kiritimatiellia bacterium]